jgi:hypothetical protein
MRGPGAGRAAAHGPRHDAHAGPFPFEGRRCRLRVSVGSPVKRPSNGVYRVPGCRAACSQPVSHDRCCPAPFLLSLGTVLRGWSAHRFVRPKGGARVHARRTPRPSPVRRAWVPQGSPWMCTCRRRAGPAFPPRPRAVGGTPRPWSSHVGRETASAGIRVPVPHDRPCPCLPAVLLIPAIGSRLGECLAICRRHSFSLPIRGFTPPHDPKEQS